MNVSNRCASCSGADVSSMRGAEPCALPGGLPAPLAPATVRSPPPSPGHPSARGTPSCCSVPDPEGCRGGAGGLAVLDDRGGPQGGGTVSGLSLGLPQLGFVALVPHQLSPWGTEGAHFHEGDAQARSVVLSLPMPLLSSSISGAAPESLRLCLFLAPDTSCSFCQKMLISRV